MILDLLTAPFMSPLKGVTWIAEQILEQAQLQMPSEQSILRGLTELELRLDLGEIDQDEFELQEDILLQQLNALRSENMPEGYTQPER